MLIREVRAANGEGEALVLGLHRELTVVAGLLPDEQIELADILAAMVYGRTEDLGGRVELNGEEMSAQVWGARVGEQFDDVDVFVRRSDVGHATAATVGLELGEPESVLEARGTLARAEKAMSAAERDLEAVRRRAEDARAAVLALGVAPDADAPDSTEELHDAGVLEGVRAELAAAEDALGAAERDLADAERDEGLARERSEAAETELEERAARLAAAAEEVGAARAAEAATQAACEAAAETLDRAHESAQPDLDAVAQAAIAAADRLAAARLAHDQATDAAEAARAAVARARAELAAARDAAAESEAAKEERDRSAAAAEIGQGELDRAAEAREAELVQIAESAMAEAEVAAAEAAAAAQAVDAARRELEGARLAAASTDPAAGSGEELEALERRAQEIEEELARARAEESLFAGFAETNRPVDREPVRSGRSGRRAERRVSAPDSEPVGDADLDAVEAEARRATAEASELRAAAEAMRRRMEATGETGEDRREAAAARRLELEREIAALGVPVDASAVVAAVSELRHVPSEAEVDQARELLAEVDALVASRRALAVRPAPTWLVDAARTALEEARVELARAEEMARPMRVSAEDAAEFERAHAAVVEAEARADRRFGGPMARRRLEKAVADERELLLKFGLPSYTAFLLRTMPISSDSAGARHLDEARRAMADAEAVWEELHQAEYPDELAAVEQEEARVLAQAAALLGPDRMADADVTTPAATLRSVRTLLVETTTADADVGHAAARLADALDAAFGSKVAPGDLTGLLAVAEERIAVTEAIAARRGELALELDAVGAEIRDIDAAAEGDDTPNADAVAEAEAAATAAEGRAEEARRRLEAAAIAAGIAPAAAAVAADVSTLDAVAEAEVAARATDAPRADSEVDWEAQAAAEVERSQREIDVLSAELASLEDRRAVLRSALRDDDGDSVAADAGPDRVDGLLDQLQAAEDRLSAARQIADAATERAAAAIERLGPPPPEAGDPEFGSADSGPDDPEAGSTVPDDPADRVARAEASAADFDGALSEAEATLAAAAAEVTAAAQEAADTQKALDAARAVRAAYDDELTGARQVLDQAEAEHRKAQATRVDAAERWETADRAAQEAEAEGERAARARVQAAARSEEAAAERDRRSGVLAERRRALAEAELEVSRRADEARAAAARLADEARERVEQWQRRYDESVAAEADASAAETVATRRVAEAGAALAAAHQALADAEARAGERASRSRSAAVADFVNGRLALARSKERYGGVPLILLDPFDAEDLPSAAPLLERAIGDVQMIYLTAEAEVLRWADALGPDRALVLRFGDSMAASG